MGKIMENPIKNGWFGGKTPYFRKHPYEWRNQHACDVLHLFVAPILKNNGIINYVSDKSY